MVKKLLEKYEDYRIEIAIYLSFHQELSPDMQQIRKKLDCLNKCIDLLDKEEADIIRRLFFKHESIKKVADVYGYSKSGMQYKRDKTVRKLSRLYEKACTYL